MPCHNYYQTTNEREIIHVTQQGKKKKKKNQGRMKRDGSKWNFKELTDSNSGGEHLSEGTVGIKT